MTKEGYYALGNRRDTDSFVAAGVGEQLYDGRIHSYFAHRRNRCDIDQNHSGAKSFVVDGG